MRPSDIHSPTARRVPALLLGLAALLFGVVALGLLRNDATALPGVLASGLAVLVLGLAAHTATRPTPRAALGLQAVATVNLALFVALTPFVVTTAQPPLTSDNAPAYAAFALWLLVSVIAFGLAFVRPAAVLRREALTGGVRVAALVLIALFWLWLLHLAHLLTFTVHPFALLPVYGWGAAVGIFALRWVERERRSWAFYVALGVASACLIRDITLSSTYYFLYETDAVGYFRYARFMFDPSISDIPIARTLNYPLVINLLLFPFNSALPVNADSFWRVVHVQIIVAAFAAGLLTYVLAKRDRALAVLAGIILATDIVWGAYQRWIFTESLTMSFLVISFAVIISHFARAQRLRTAELLAAGLLFGWTLTLRASNLYFAAAIVVIYLLFTRSIRKTTLVTVGIGLFLVAASLFNLWRFDAFRLSGQQGFFLGWPALGYQLYAPDNGPLSAQFTQEVAACHPDLDLTGIPADFVNWVIWQQIIPCYDNDLDVVTERFSAIFGEAFRRRPLDYLTTVARENVMLLAYPIRPTTPFVLQTTIEMFRDPLRPPVCTDTPASWCNPRPYPRDTHDPLLVAFANVSNVLVQPYLLLAPPGDLPPGRTEELYRYLAPPLTQPPAMIPAALGWFAMLGFTLLNTRGLRRFVVLVSAALVHYVILVVTAAMVYDVLNTRLLTAASPFFGLIAAVFFLTVAQKLRRLSSIRWRKVPPGGG